MKRFQWKGALFHNAREFKLGTLLLAKCKVDLFLMLQDTEVLLEVCYVSKPRRRIFRLISSSIKAVNFENVYTWEFLNRDRFKNVRVLDRSDLPLCMHLRLGKEFEKLLKGSL